MPLSVPPSLELVRRARRIRKRPAVALAIAIGGVAVATLIRYEATRLGISSESAPFTTYYLAIIVAALTGGPWFGLLATLLSAVAAWLLFIPPEFSFDFTAERALSLTLFMVTAATIVLIITLMNRAFDWVESQAKITRALVESAPYGILVVDAKGRISSLNEHAERMFGYDRSELIGQPVEAPFPFVTADEHGRERQRLLAEADAPPRSLGDDTKGRRKDGTEFPVEVILTPINREGVTGLVTTVIDITERKEAQDRQQLLVGELQHRTHNLFSVIQAIAARTLDKGRAKSAFEARIHALSRAHRMLANSAWTGAPLTELIKSELGPFAENVSIQGCDLSVNTTAAQQFALVLHELATNAAKYGALATPEGRIMIRGHIDRSNGYPVFSMSWKESGGPPVRKPGRKGFGSTILIDSAKSFGSDANLTFDPDGLSYSMRLSLSTIEVANAASDVSTKG